MHCKISNVIKLQGLWGRLAKMQLFCSPAVMQICWGSTTAALLHRDWPPECSETGEGVGAHIHIIVNFCCKYLKQNIFLFRNTWVNLCGLFIHLYEMENICMWAIFAECPVFINVYICEFFCVDVFVLRLFWPHFMPLSSLKLKADFLCYQPNLILVLTHPFRR